jgi:hypothetical protein
MNRSVISATLRAIAAALLASGLTLVAHAQTPDEETPASEDICGDLEGAQYGQCNAYCEAMDCHLGEGVRASKTACDRALDRYRSKFNADPPCIVGNCAISCAAEAMDTYDTCIAAGDDPSLCVYAARLHFNRCYRIDCPATCYKGCLQTCAPDDKACVVECRDQCYPRQRCTLVCDQRHGEALISCAAQYDPASCNGDPNCEADTSYNRDTCVAAADVQYSTCMSGCETASGACSAEDIEMCGGRDRLCSIDGVCTPTCSLVWTEAGGCKASVCDALCIQPR